MPMDFLRSIERVSFPIRVSAPYEVNCVHVLHAAELIEVAPVQADGDEEPVTVLGISALGRAALQREDLRRPPEIEV